MLKGGRAEQQVQALIPLAMAAAVGGAVSVTIVAMNQNSAPLAIPIVWLYILLGLTLYYALGSLRASYVKVERTYREVVDEVLWIVHMKRQYRGEDSWASVLGPYCPKDYSGMISRTKGEALPGERKEWVCPKCQHEAWTDSSTANRVRGLARGRWNRGERSHGGIFERITLPTFLRRVSLTPLINGTCTRVIALAEQWLQKLYRRLPRYRKK